MDKEAKGFLTCAQWMLMVHVDHAAPAIVMSISHERTLHFKSPRL